MLTAEIMLAALALDGALGWPARLHARIGHPVTWIGAAIAWFDARINRPHRSPADRRGRGVVVAILVIAGCAAAAAAAESLLPDGFVGVLIAGALAWPLIAARSMHAHVAAVARPLIAGDLPAARLAVAEIVGRDPKQLDAAGVGRATLESLAENTSDGVVAPIFWGLVFGLPGIAAYKAVNTLDSMIGHRTERHAAFGWASARIDDVANLVPARLTGLLFALVSGRLRIAFATMLRDARRHRSPNAGWPEAAMAGALGVRLSGPRRYAGRVAQEPWLNADAPDPAPADIDRGLALYRRAMIALAVLLLVLAAL